MSLALPDVRGPSPPRTKTSGRSCPSTSSTRPRVPARESQPGASCPHTRSPGARVSPHAGAFCCRCAAFRRAAPLAGPFPSPCRPTRYAVPLAVPPRSPPIRRVHHTARRATRCRSAFAHPTRWHSVSARSEPAQCAITPQQWSRHAITPRQWNRCAITPRQCNRHAITPQQRSQRAETPQQHHHRPSADAYEPLAKRTSQELRPDLGC